MSRVHMGDNLPWLRSLPDESVDSLVTDPPYGLSKPPPIEELLKHWMGLADYEHKASGFMGKDWDSMVPSPETWREVFRVLKPGAHGVVFAGQRTVDLMGISLRLAGFEVRDTAGWLTFTGFPKSLNVSIALDSLAGVEREVVGLKRHARDGDVSGQAWATLERGDPIAMQSSLGKGCGLETIPTSPEAQQWAGFGSAIKPAIEPFLLIRKPLRESSIARQVLATGTGALNIDGCRYPQGDKAWPGPQEGEPTLHASNGGDRIFDMLGGCVSSSGGSALGGRFPANICHAPKASTKERERGTEGLPGKAGHEMVNREEGSAGTMNPRAGAGRMSGERRNIHPTCKPVRLMRWLCRLVTPPGGTLIEPYMGSGTTGVAAVLEGFEFLGAEFTPEYHAIAEARIAHAVAHPGEWADTEPGVWDVEKPTKPKDTGTLSLFG